MCRRSRGGGGGGGGGVFSGGLEMERAEGIGMVLFFKWSYAKDMRSLKGEREGRGLFSSGVIRTI